MVLEAKGEGRAKEPTNRSIAEGPRGIEGDELAKEGLIYVHLYRPPQTIVTD